MGLCCGKAVPKDEILNSKPSAVVPASSSPTNYESTTTSESVPGDTDAESNLPRVQLIGDVFCAFTLRVLIALQFKGVLVDATWLSSGDSTNLKLLNDNPNGKYPVLQYGHHKLIGSTDIMLDYIEETFQDPTLIPKPLSGEVEKWVAFIRDEFSPIVGRLLYGGSPPVQRELRSNLEAAFVKLDSGKREHGRHGRFFLGSHFTLVDVYLIPTLLLVDISKFFRGIEIGAAHSHLLAYSRAMHSFPNYAPVRVDPELLKGAVAKVLDERALPPLIVMTVLQHNSVLWHLERIVALADSLPVNTIEVEVGESGRRGAGKQLQRLWKVYGRLVDLMQEHAQMEERVIFPAIDSTEEGMSESALSDHARDFPIMNGIREDIKGVMALEQGCADHLDALQALATRLGDYRKNVVEHYHEEERDLLPQLNIADLGRKMQEEMVTQCYAVMEESHGRLLPFLLQGLQPHEVYQYLGLFQKAFEGGKSRVFTRMSFCLKNADEEFKEVCKLAQERIVELIAAANDDVAGS